MSKSDRKLLLPILGFLFSLALSVGSYPVPQWIPNVLLLLSMLGGLWALATWDRVARYRSSLSDEAKGMSVAASVIGVVLVGWLIPWQRPADPMTQVQAELASIRQGLGEAASKSSLLKKYPLGYTIFGISDKNIVTPYETGGLEDFVFDWSVVGITKNTDRIELRLPDAHRKSDNSLILSEARTGGRMQVGNLGGYTFAGKDGHMLFCWGEILAIRSDGTIFLVGFQKGPAVPKLPSAK